jgi:hypothetical protein
LIQLARAIDASARKQLEDEVFGKRVLITNRIHVYSRVCTGFQ